MSKYLGFGFTLRSDNRVDVCLATIQDLLTDWRDEKAKIELPIWGKHEF